MRARNLSLSLCLLASCSYGQSGIEPYAELNGGTWGKAVPASPDPLAAYTWNLPLDLEHLQILPLPPVRAIASVPGCASNLPSLLGGYGNASVSLTCSVTLFFDWSVEHAAWVEFLSPSSGVVASTMVGVSEYAAPRAPDGAISPPMSPPTAYPGGVYRLETNKALYDGVRYAFLQFTCPSPCSTPLLLTGVRAVHQALPLNYVGSFASSDPLLDRVWYTGAYSVRVNAIPNFLGSELLSRGDRPPPFQGDAHVSQAVALLVHGVPGWPLVKAMTNLTDSAERSVHDSNIASYPLCWVLSVVDLYSATGDATLLLSYASSVDTILDLAVNTWFGSATQPTDLRGGGGGHDRLGSGFADCNETPEARRFLWLITLRATNAFLQAAAAAGGGGALAPLISKYTPLAASMTAATRATGGGGGAWLNVYGIHSLAEAVNGGWTTPAENAVISALFKESSTIASFSNYNTGYILEALGSLGAVDYGTALVRMAWGAQLSAGATCWWETGSSWALAGMGVGTGDVDVVLGATSSLCHAWGSLATPWLTKYVLGIRALAPGHARFLFAPSIGGTGPANVRGDVPTRYGVVSASAAVAVEGGVHTYTLSLTAPAGTTATLRLPHKLATLLACEAGGQDCAPSAVGVEGGGIEWAVGAGVHTMVVRVRGGAPPPAPSTAAAAFPYPPFAAPVWPAQVTVDNTTHGDWVGVLGGAGYALFGYAPGGGNVQQLPSWVQSVTPGAGSATGPVTGAHLPDPVALLADPSGGPAHLGSQSAGGNSLYNLWFDVVVAPGAPLHNMSIYVTDTTGTGDGALVVRVESLPGKSPIIPDVALRHYRASPFGVHINEAGGWGLEKGVWVRVAYNASSRVRLYCAGVSGCSASVSAVVWDA